MPEAAKQPQKDAKDDKPQKPARKGGLKGTIILVAIVAVVEAGLFFAAMKMFGGGPQVAHGEQPDTNHLAGAEPAATKESVELELLAKFRVPNDKSGRLFIYDMDLYVKVDAEHKGAIEKVVKERKGELSDKVARIIRGNETDVLHEADLKSLRMQVRHALGELTGDAEIVQEVLIPRFVPMRAD